MKKSVQISCLGLIGWCCCNQAFAQTGGVISSADSTQSLYIANFPQKFLARTFVSVRNFNFILRSRVGQKRSISYAPNGREAIGVGFFYKKAGLEIGIKLPASDAGNQRYGKTRYLDWQVNYYGSRIGADLAIQRYRGFYVRNPFEVDSTWQPGDNYPQRSDLLAFNVIGNVYYIFNHKKYSFRAAFAQTERQTQSAGSFVLMGSVNRLRIDSDGNLIPVANQETFGDQTDFRSGSFYGFSILPGYAHTFVLNRFYVALSLHLGAGVQYKRYTIDDSFEREWALVRKNNLRMAAGYYGNRFLAGTSLFVDNTGMRLQNLQLSASSFNVRFFVGYLFNSPELDKLITKQRRKIKFFNRKSVRDSETGNR